jgi:hypothetical protein
MTMAKKKDSQRRLTRTTIVQAPPGSGQSFAIFGPDDEDIPDWALEQLGDHCFGEATVEAAAPPEPKVPDTGVPSGDDGDDGDDGDGEDDDDGEDDEVNLDDLTKAELVELAEKAGVAKTGNKDALIDRLAEHFAAQDDDQGADGSDD